MLRVLAQVVLALERENMIELNKTDGIRLIVCP